MQIKYTDLKLGATYYITNPDTETVQEVYLQCCELRPEDILRYCFEKTTSDPEQSDYIWLYVKDDEEVFDGEHVKIVVFATREEAEAARAEILIAGHESAIKSYEKDIEDFKSRIQDLRASQNIVW